MTVYKHGLQNGDTYWGYLLKISETAMQIILCMEASNTFRLTYHNWVGVLPNIIPDVFFFFNEHSLPYIIIKI